jgi:hypothetical protein
VGVGVGVSVGFGVALGPAPGDGTRVAGTVGDAEGALPEHPATLNARSRPKMAGYVTRKAAVERN